MPADKAHLRQQLIDSRALLDRVLDSVDGRWETPVYSDGAAWNVLQLARHLADADRGQTRVVMAVAQGENPVPADFDVERYNQRMTEKQASMTIEEARAMLNSTRAKLFTWLDGLDDAALEREGRHATLRMLTVAGFLDIMAQHELLHARDIARVLNLPA